MLFCRGRKEEEALDLVEPDRERDERLQINPVSFDGLLLSPKVVENENVTSRWSL